MITPRIATAVLLTHGEDPQREVYLVKRSSQLKAFAGQWAFPGGTVDAIDEQHAGSQHHTLLRCAMREILEETGLLLMPDAHPPADLTTIRQALLDDGESPQWAALIDSIEVERAGFNPVCEFTTPPISKVRFQTQFMQIQLNASAEPTIIPGELDEGAFFSADQAIKLWEAGEMAISPPVLFLLKLMQGRPLAEFIALASKATADFEQGRLPPGCFSPGIFLAPLKTPTLPPAITTNTLIIGNEQRYIVDPATPDADEQQKLMRQLDDYLAQGKQLKAILLTHHHPDHIGAVNVISQHYQLPVRAHPETYRRIPEGYIKGEPLSDGEHIALGVAPDGSDDWQLEAIYTPGHAVDHICFIENRYHAAIVGDMLSTLSTIVIDPPEGHMRTYLNSLHLLQQREIKALFPAHGHVYSEGGALISEYIQHRADREQAIVKALGKEPQSLPALVVKIYHDMPPQAHHIASRSLLAGLIKLQEDGVCKEQAGNWCRR